MPSAQGEAAVEHADMCANARSKRSSCGARQLDAALVDAERAGGGDDGRPGIVGQRNALGETLPARSVLGLAGGEDLGPRRDGLGTLEVAEVTRDIRREEPFGIDHRGVDVERQHAVAAERALALAGGLHARERAAQQLANERQSRALVVAEGPDRTLAGAGRTQT